MSLASLSIKRPAFISSIIILMVAVGLLSAKNLGVDMFPNATFPVVTVTTPYPGSGPAEIETLVSRVLEDEISGISGMKSVRSVSKEGISTVIAEFSLETDIRYAEQQIRDRVGSAKRKLPSEIKEPVIRKLDPGDQAILVISLSGQLPEGQLYDLADTVLRPQLEQVPQVGLVDIAGGRKREIRVELDRNKLQKHELPASVVSGRVAAAGQNVPAGKVSGARQEMIFRTLGEFKSLDQIRNTVVNFMGNDVAVTVGQIGKVTDALEDEKTRAYVNGEKSIFINVFRQSGANTIAVAEQVKARIGKINEDLASQPGKPQLQVVRDRAKMIRANVADVEESIYIGIALTIFVVFYFLGNFRSTLITGLALPNSLLGAFILMAMAGFTINIMTLLAMSLAVGLLIDDAIVVRENIFKHLERGEKPQEAALKGTTEVSLAVIATTLTVLAVFGPIGFLKGVVGQFFKQFGLTVCFAMSISLFDALTIAPMLSAYFAGSMHSAPSKNPIARAFGATVRWFQRFQDWLEVIYERSLHATLRYRILVLGVSLAIFVGSVWVARGIPKTFLPAQETGEFEVSLDMPPGTSLEAMSEAARKVDAAIRRHPEVRTSVLTVGGRDGESNIADFFVELVPSKERKSTTSQVKERVRQDLRQFASANPKVKDVDMIGAGQRPFNLNIIGSDFDQLEKISLSAFEKLKAHPSLKDVDISYRPGKPEFQVVVNDERAQRLGVSSVLLGRELRTRVEGAVPAVYRDKGREYDIRVRLQDDQRDLRQAFNSTFVPNINNTMIRLEDVAAPVTTASPSNISRQDRGRYIQISADLDPAGPGMGQVMKDVETMFKSEIPLPNGVRYKYVGQAENFAELVQSMIVAVLLGVFFIYLVLTSLYESFVTPFTIMLVLPLAASGAFLGLYGMGQSLDVYSMIGSVMLLGIATKNSILLVDAINQLIAAGVDRTTAIIQASKSRLRPILMTSFALIMGMLPVAIGLNEASKQRTSMGVAVIGGLITSTFLTLLVVPAAYTYIEKFRLWSLSRARKAGGVVEAGEGVQSVESEVGKTATSLS